MALFGQAVSQVLAYPRLSGGQGAAEDAKASQETTFAEIFRDLRQEAHPPGERPTVQRGEASGAKTVNQEEDAGRRVGSPRCAIQAQPAEQGGQGKEEEEPSAEVAPNQSREETLTALLDLLLLLSSHFNKPGEGASEEQQSPIPPAVQGDTRLEPVGAAAALPLTGAGRVEPLIAGEKGDSLANLLGLLGLDKAGSWDDSASTAVTESAQLVALAKALASGGEATAFAGGPIRSGASRGLDPLVGAGVFPGQGEKGIPWLTWGTPGAVPAAPLRRWLTLLRMVEAAALVIPEPGTTGIDDPGAVIRLLATLQGLLERMAGTGGESRVSEGGPAGAGITGALEDLLGQTGLGAARSTAGANVAGDSPGANFQDSAGNESRNGGGKPQIPLALTPAALAGTGSPSTQAVMGPTGGEPASQMVMRLEEIQKLVAQAQVSGGKVHSLTLQLQPPELGSVRVMVALEGGEVVARFQTQTAAARYALEAGLPALRESLQQNGLVVQRCEVAVETRTDSHSGQSPFTAQTAFWAADSRGDHRSGNGAAWAERARLTAREDLAKGTAPGGEEARDRLMGLNWNQVNYLA